MECFAAAATSQLRERTLDTLRSSSGFGERGLASYAAFIIYDMLISTRLYQEKLTEKIAPVWVRLMLARATECWLSLRSDVDRLGCKNSKQPMKACAIAFETFNRVEAKVVPIFVCEVIMSGEK